MIQDQNQQHVEVFDAENNGGEGKQSTSTLTWVLVGIGAAAAIGLLIWLIVASTKKTENDKIDGQNVTEEEVLPWTKIDGKIKYLGSDSSTITTNGKTVSKQVYEVEDRLGRRQIPKEQYDVLDKDYMKDQAFPLLAEQESFKLNKKASMKSSAKEPKTSKFIKIEGNITALRSRCITHNGKVSKEVYEVTDDLGCREVPKEQYETLEIHESCCSKYLPFLGLAGLAALVIVAKSYLF